MGPRFSHRLPLCLALHPRALRRTAAPIACFTATAKPEVIADLSEHFEVNSGSDLTRYIGGHERTNLQYQIVPVTKAEKPARVIDLVREALAGDSGGAIVFTATRRNAEVPGRAHRGRGMALRVFPCGAGARRRSARSSRASCAASCA